MAHHTHHSSTPLRIRRVSKVHVTASVILAITLITLVMVVNTIITAYYHPRPVYTLHSLTSDSIPTVTPIRAGPVTWKTYNGRSYTIQYPNNQDIHAMIDIVTFTPMELSIKTTPVGVESLDEYLRSQKCAEVSPTTGIAVQLDTAHGRMYADNHCQTTVSTQIYVIDRGILYTISVPHMTDQVKKLIGSFKLRS